MRYRVYIKPNRKQYHAIPVDVIADSGDEAAVKARQRLHGAVYQVEQLGRSGGRPKKARPVVPLMTAETLGL